MLDGCMRSLALALVATFVAAGCGDDKLNKKKPEPLPPGTIGAGCQTDADCYSGDCVGGKCAASADPMTAAEICALYISASINTDPEGPGLCVQGTMGNANDLNPEMIAYYCRPGTSGFTWGSKMLTAVAESRLRVDWAAARECLSTTRFLRATKPGIELIKGSEWSAAKEGICSSFYDGNIPLNGACKEDWDCPKDAGCFSDAPTTPGSSFCLPPAQNGEPCSLDFHTCAEGLRCAENGQCGPKLNNSQPCVWNDDCVSGYCDYYEEACATSPYLAAGESCTRGSQETGCDGECMACRRTAAGGPTVCQHYAAAGEYCDDWNDCLWDLGCINHLCGTVGQGQNCGALSQATCAEGLSCIPMVDCTRYDGDAAACAEHDEYCVFDSYYGYCDIAEGMCARLPSSGACVEPELYPVGMCAAGFFCDDDSTCQPLGRQGAPCSESAPCDDSLGLYCYPDTCVRFCEVIEDCPTGQYCDPGDESTPPRCLPINEAECAGDYACPAGKYCDFPGNQCFTYGDETSCNADADGECLWVAAGDCVADDACDTHLDQATCEADTADRCAWVEVGTCDAPACLYETEEDCNDDPLCWWSAQYGCGDNCWEFDDSPTNCDANPSCMHDGTYCWSKCYDYADRGACTGDVTCTWETGDPPFACVGGYDCSQHEIAAPADITTCTSSGPCAFEGEQYCDMLDPDAMGACADKLAVGTACIPDNVAFMGPVPSDSANQCQIGYATWVGPGDYDYQCSVAPNPPVDYTGCLNYTQDAQHALINLVWLFGAVWFVGHRRNKRR